jgi:polyhydroxybutyrate depolymerase
MILGGMVSAGFSVVSAQTDAAAVTCVPTGGIRAAGTAEYSLVSNDITRRYLIHTPVDYDPSALTPAVFVLHGFINTPEQIQMFSRMDEVADASNFLVIYPQGTAIPLRWNAAATPNGDNHADDVQYIADLVDVLIADHCVNPAQIYVSGLSNGGGMTNRLACELTDRFAAFGGVAGAYPQITGGCNPTRPAPMIAFHGTDDRIVPYQGSSSFPAIEDWAAAWAERNHCALEPETLVSAGEVSGIRYRDCAGDAEVILYTIDGGGHTWPGGTPIPIAGTTSDAISASETMWAFFQQHTLEADSTGE